MIGLILIFKEARIIILHRFRIMMAETYRDKNVYLAGLLYSERRKLL